MASMSADIPTLTRPFVDNGKVEGRVAAVRLPILDARQPLRAQGRGPMAQPEHPEVVSSEPLSFTLGTSGSRTPKPRVNVGWKPRNGEKEHMMLPKRVNTRGTRGRGDPRNEGMRRAREQFELEKRVEEQRLTQQQEARERLTSTMTGEHTVVLRGRGQSEFVRSSLGDGPDNSPDPPNDPSFTQHHPHTSPTQRRTQANGEVIMIHGPPSSTGRRNNIFQRPSPQAPRVTMQQTQSGPVMRRPDDWTHWDVLSVKLSGLPTNVTTRDVWTCLSREGCIQTIELFEDNRGNRDGKGRVRFS